MYFFNFFRCIINDKYSRTQGFQNIKFAGFPGTSIVFRSSILASFDVLNLKLGFHLPMRSWLHVRAPKSVIVFSFFNAAIFDNFEQSLVILNWLVLRLPQQLHSSMDLVFLINHF